MEMITVLLPTHNGAKTIGRTLEALSKLVPPHGGWKLVIVNNASTDNTEEIISRWKCSLPVEVVQQPRLGKSAAVNLGLEFVDGDFVIFIDDDVLPEQDWLIEWRRVADEYPECDAFGGAALPEFEVQPPSWFGKTQWAGILYSATRQLPEGRTLGNHEMFGLNMAIRSGLIFQGLRFDEGLMIGSYGLLGDDTDFGDRIEQRGFNVGFAPTTQVAHMIGRECVTRRWMLRRFTRHGRTLAYFDEINGINRSAKVMGVPRYLIRRIVERIIALPFVAASFDDLRIMCQLRLLAYDLGAVAQTRRMTRQRTG